ncbi:MAG: hypothetical protein ACYCQJ_12985 [Nitrososphaerales archaeon]
MAILVIGVFGLAIFTTYALQPKMFSVGLQNGAEGPQAIAFGFQPSDSNTINYVNNPSSFSDPPGGSGTDTWNAGSGGYNGGLQRCFAACDPTHLTYSISIPEPSCNYNVGLFGGLCLLGQDTGQSFSYSGGVGCSSSSQCTQKVHADVYSSTFAIELDAYGNDGIQFSDQALWMNLFVNIWGIQMCDPTNTTVCQQGSVWGAPLEAVITQVQINCGNATASGGNCFDKLVPDSQGAAFTLWNGVTNQAPAGGPVPYTPATIQNYLQNGGSPLSPDQSLYQYTQTNIGFAGFGPYGCGFLNAYSCPVDVTLTVQVYYLVIGSFLWTNPNTTPYKPNPLPGPNDLVQQFLGFLGTLANGFVNIGYNFFLTLVVATIVIVAIIVSGVILIARRPRR